MAKTLEDFSPEMDVDDSEAAVERRRNDKKVCKRYFIPVNSVRFQWFHSFESEGNGRN